MPCVSIVTPLFNKGAYIAETIASVQAQTMADWELIVVDNLSTDDGPHLVRGISDTRVRLVSETQPGPGAARNHGVKVASGEWLLFLDADDVIERDHLDELLRAAGAQSGCDLVVSRWRKFSDSVRQLEEPEIPNCEGKTNAELLDSAIAFAPWAVHAALLRRKVLVRDLFWPEHLDCYLGEDIAFWFKVLTRVSGCRASTSAGALYRWKTADCRTQNEDAERWFSGLHSAATENVAFCKREGRRMTAGQSASLMRLYESIYILARRTNDHAVAAKARTLASYWLNQSLRCLPWRWTLIMRRVFGFYGYTALRRCTLSPV